MKFIYLILIFLVCTSIYGLSISEPLKEYHRTKASELDVVFLYSSWYTVPDQDTKIRFTVTNADSVHTVERLHINATYSGVDSRALLSDQNRSAVYRYVIRKWIDCSDNWNDGISYFDTGAIHPGQTKYCWSYDMPSYNDNRLDSVVVDSIETSTLVEE